MLLKGFSNVMFRICGFRVSFKWYSKKRNFMIYFLRHVLFCCYCPNLETFWSIDSKMALKLVKGLIGSDILKE